VIRAASEPSVDHLVVQVQILHQCGVVGDEAGVTVEYLAFVAGLRRLEHVGVLVEVAPVQDVGMLLGQGGGDVPADVADQVG